MLSVLCSIVLLETQASDSWQEGVADFARQQLGKQVGRGECAELSAEALDAIKAKPYGTWPDSPSSGDYVWGNRKATITPSTKEIELKTGDILQFRNVRIVTKSGNTTYTYTTQQHTSIIEKYNPETKVATVLQQNSNGRKYVTRDTINLAGVKSGTIWVYKPVPISSR